MTEIVVTTYSESGEFGKVLRGPAEFISANTQLAFGHCEGEHSSQDEYFDLAMMEPTSKRALEVYYPGNIAADGEAVAVIQIPEYVGVYFTGPFTERTLLADDEVRFSVPKAGKYTFTFDGPEILTQEVSINAN